MWANNVVVVSQVFIEEYTTLPLAVAMIQTNNALPPGIPLDKFVSRFARVVQVI